MNFDDIDEITYLEDGTEVLLRVDKAEIVPKKSKPDEIQWSIRLSCADDPLVDTIYHYQSIPSLSEKKEDPKKYAKAMLYLKDMYLSMGVDPSSVRAEDLEGQEAWALVSYEDTDRGPRNSVVKFLVNK